jgi:heme/copper-type cytochrome/quinol oxidase subunit 1
VTSLVRRYLKTAVVFLAVGIVLGVWMIVQRELLRRTPAPTLVSAHTHVVLVGFVMMMILGVALWMFPRPARGDERYKPWVAEGAYWLVTLGTGTRVVGEMARTSLDQPWLRWAIVMAGIAQGAGLVAFFLTMWSRIRPVGSASREAAGERF